MNSVNVHVQPAPLIPSHTWQISAELPIPLPSFRDSATDNSINIWRSRKASMLSLAEIPGAACHSLRGLMLR